MKEIVIEVDDKMYRLLIGENSVENTRIVKQAHPKDLWFHLEHFSGPHIVLCSKGEDVPKRCLNKIASMFRIYKSNIPMRYRVIYTAIQNVKISDVVGEVIVTNTRFIKI